ncbi:hypothetical protein [Nocardia sp. JCM 34519.1]|uniref:hypothetical protein n=1 Tax=unclassified Nocardia TaxID=2637762 RepID=UPI0035A888B5
MVLVSGRLRLTVGVLLAAVAALLVMSACSSKESNSGASATSSASNTSVTPSQTAPQGNPNGSPDRGKPRADSGSGTDGCGNSCGTDSDQTVAPATTALDHCGIEYCGAPAGDQNQTAAPTTTALDHCGIEYCGAPGGDNYVKCTDKINYAGDPRSNAEINIIGERDGKCPEPIRITTAPARPSATTSAAPKPTPAVTTTTK